jgi:hypothetical protein
MADVCRRAAAGLREAGLREADPHVAGLHAVFHPGGEKVAGPPEDETGVRPADRVAPRMVWTGGQSVVETADRFAGETGGLPEV